MRALLPLACLAVACTAPPPPRVAVAAQEPVALLSLPQDAQAGVRVTFDAGACFDIDGALTAATLDFGDGSPLEERAADVTAWRFEHVYPSAGRFVVQLEVTDDQGLVGRARVPLIVAPPPDQGAPVLEALTLRAAGATLADGALVPSGAALEVLAQASDAEGNLDGVLVEAGSASVMLEDGAMGSLTLVEVGARWVRATALDTYGNRSAPLELHLRVIAPDSDGDGLPDLDDLAPDLENGLTAELFLLDDLFDNGIPTDLFGNPKAERVVQALDGATPIMTRNVTSGYLAHSGDDDLIATLFPDTPDAPDAAGGFVLRFFGFMVPPIGADAVQVEITAEEVGVVLLGGSPVASADEEYATDLFRFDRVPAESAELPLAGRAAVEIVVAKDGGQASWAARFRFLSEGVSVLLPEAVGPQQFTVR